MGYSLFSEGDFLGALLRARVLGLAAGLKITSGTSGRPMLCAVPPWPIAAGKLSPSSAWACGWLWRELLVSPDLLAISGPSDS